jgi:hypothetical protein
MFETGDLVRVLSLIESSGHDICIILDVIHTADDLRKYPQYNNLSFSKFPPTGGLVLFSESRRDTVFWFGKPEDIEIVSRYARV